MLGDGIVSFGVPRLTTDFRKSKWSPKMQPSSPSLPSTAQPRGREVDVALVAVKMHGDVLLDLAHAADLVQEIHVPGRAAEFAIGDALQAELFLHRHDVANRIVFGLAQRRRHRCGPALCSARARVSSGGRSRLPT